VIATTNIAAIAGLIAVLIFAILVALYASNK
jgi:hypothetical protein